MDNNINQVFTKEETDKKCPNCAAVMDFDPTTGGLLCAYCGFSKEVESKEEIQAAAELDFNQAENFENCNWGEGKKNVICKSCGAESIYDELEVANECPYCGSNQVMEAFAHNTIAPGGVCPFAIDKKSAGSRFKDWIKRKIFCPSEVKKNAKPDKFKGMYVPYWTFDTTTVTDYTAKYGRTRTVRDSKGNTRTVTDWHKTSGRYEEFINDQLVLGSDRHNETEFKKIEPFDTESNVSYKPEYIAGFVAERYSVGLKAAWEKAKGFIKKYLTRRIEYTIKENNNADKVGNLVTNTVFYNVTYKYLMLPIWISSFQYKGKTYQFLVNGQTGKVGGKTPISPLRVAIAIFLGVIVIGTIYYFGYYY